MTSVWFQNSIDVCLKYKKNPLKPVTCHYRFLTHSAWLFTWCLSWSMIGRVYFHCFVLLCVGLVLHQGIHLTQQSCRLQHRLHPEHRGQNTQYKSKYVRVDSRHPQASNIPIWRYHCLGEVVFLKIWNQYWLPSDTVHQRFLFISPAHLQT